MSLGDSSTELGKVRGLGSAREGGEHWIGERVSSIALLLLGVWLIASLLMLPGTRSRHCPRMAAHAARRGADGALRHYRFLSWPRPA
jgi:hypothetical protein